MKTGHFVLLCGLLAGMVAPVGANERFVDEISGIEFVKIPGGCFAIGADRPGEPHPSWPIPMPAADEVPRHEVCVDAFWLGVTEVTRDQWTKVTGHVLYGSNMPVTDVSWEAAVKFTETLNEKHAKANSSGGFRLPTEAEWEFGCHAGNYKPAVQVYDSPGFNRLHEETFALAWYRYRMWRDPTAKSVKGKHANAWGLYDMLGNLWEWTLDGYDASAYARHARENPRQAAADERRVLRGGSYKTDITKVRCGARSYAPAFDRSPLFGFRVAREVVPKK